MINIDDVIKFTENEDIFLLAPHEYPANKTLEFYSICPCCNTHYYILHDYEPTVYERVSFWCEDCDLVLGKLFNANLRWAKSYV